MAELQSETLSGLVEFVAKESCVILVIKLGENSRVSSIELPISSPERLLDFMTRLMDKAVIVWPDNQFIKEYGSE